MTTGCFRLCLSFAIALAYVCVLMLPAVCLAQQTDPNGPPTDANQDASGCAPLTILWPIAGATVENCQHGDSVEVTFLLKPDAQGNAQEKRVRGAYEFREYQVEQSQQELAFDNMMRELPMAGFKIKYSSKPSTITARKEAIWALINFSGESYSVSLVKEPPEVWASAKTAADISREMQAHNRVDIYGIQFSPDDQSILEKESQILFEILRYLKQNNDISVVVESDKITPNRLPEVDSEITGKRANAVMDWLIAHGVARSRVQPRPAGRNNPITENESPSEIQRNERIVLIKSAP
jgi:outer membrane protein OmpA-like peptidoglycan-associated protein